MTPVPKTRPAGATLASVVTRLSGLSSPALWRKADLERALSRAGKKHLDAALTRLQADGQLVALTHGETMFYAFAKPLRERLASTSPPDEPATDLRTVYRRLVRESGGFPDVKISVLARALGRLAAAELSAQLLARWRAGEATLSLGDWSLANEETRAAAVELHGEKYLLVRFEEG